MQQESYIISLDAILELELITLHKIEPLIKVNRR